MSATTKNNSEGGSNEEYDNIRGGPNEENDNISVKFIGFDGICGKIISKRKDRWTYFHDDKIMADLQLTLNQAVIKAEQTTGGRAVSAELEVEDGLAVFQIRMVVDGLSRRILVDPNNGKIYHVNQRPRDDE